MFEHLLDVKKEQVFLMACPANLPVAFAMHPWFVVNRRGALSRWEVTFQARVREMSWGHLNKDLFPFTQGIEVFPFSERLFWSGRLLGLVEGVVAAEMAELIESSDTEYPYAQQYHLLGPNSNTYAQWVLNRFPQGDLALPWNAFGKEWEGLR